METRTLIRTDKNGTAYYNVVYPCYTCRGTGYRPEYAHVEGEKVTVDVCLTRVSGFASRFGYTNVYTFEDKNHNLLVWKTGTCLDLEVGAHTTLTGTIKEHSEYRDTKQTVLTRCKLAAA